MYNNTIWLSIEQHTQRYNIHFFFPSENDTWDEEETMTGLTFLGYVGIDETVRKQVTRHTLLLSQFTTKLSKQSFLI